MSWAGLIIRAGFLMGKSEGKRQLGRLDVDEMKMLQYVLKK
jgi:hypothetical protein